MNVECSVSFGDCYFTLQLNETEKGETERAYAAHLIDKFYEKALHIGSPIRKQKTSRPNQTMNEQAAI